MNNPVALIIFIVIFGGIVLYVIISSIRRREMSFTGVVTDKDIIESRQVNNGMNSGSGIMLGGMNSGVTHEYMIRVKTDEGKEIRYKISEGMYEIIKIGDKVSKPHGTTEITIVSSSPSPAVQPVTQPTPAPAPAPPVDPNRAP